MNKKKKKKKNKKNTEQRPEDEESEVCYSVFLDMMQKESWCNWTDDLFFFDGNIGQVCDFNTISVFFTKRFIQTWKSVLVTCFFIVNTKHQTVYSGVFVCRYNIRWFPWIAVVRELSSEEINIFRNIQQWYAQKSNDTSRAERVSTDQQVCQACGQSSVELLYCCPDCWPCIYCSHACFELDIQRHAAEDCPCLITAFEQLLVRVIPCTTSRLECPSRHPLTLVSTRPCIWFQDPIEFSNVFQRLPEVDRVVTIRNTTTSSVMKFLVLNEFYQGHAYPPDFEQASEEAMRVLGILNFFKHHCPRLAGLSYEAQWKSVVIWTDKALVHYTHSRLSRFFSRFEHWFFQLKVNVHKNMRCVHHHESCLKKTSLLKWSTSLNFLQKHEHKVANVAKAMTMHKISQYRNHFMRWKNDNSTELHVVRTDACRRARASFNAKTTAIVLWTWKAYTTGKHCLRKRHNRIIFQQRTLNTLGVFRKWCTYSRKKYRQNVSVLRVYNDELTKEIEYYRRMHMAAWATAAKCQFDVVQLKRKLANAQRVQAMHEEVAKERVHAAIELLKQFK